MTRLEALERVAAAARQWAESTADYSLTNWRNTKAALAVLDALPPEEAGETVEVAVWQHAQGDIRLALIGSVADSLPWTRLGTTRLTVTKGGGT